jgi:hypothetical protein
MRVVFGGSTGGIEGVSTGGGVVMGAAFGAGEGVAGDVSLTTGLVFLGKGLAVEGFLGCLVTILGCG